MATVPSSISGSARGIANSLSGFVVESENITDTDINEPVDDQNGARADELTYDTRWDLRLTVYSASNATTRPAASGAANFVYGSKTWKVDSCEEAGTYNGRRRWIITAHRFTNYPAPSSNT